MFRKGDEPIPGYRLEQFLGKGQFGEVWRTSAPGGTSAALKFIDLGGKQGIKEFRGIQRVKEIRHANLMPITALWLLDGEGNILSDRAVETYNPDGPSAQATLAVQDAPETRPEWLVVAMLLGKKNLLDRLNECVAEGNEGIPVDELLRYMEEAAKGIDYLNSAQHDLGEGGVAIQHCDIKPANIMLIGGAAVVCDFGLARVLSDAAATATGMVGSPAYMAPECIRRKPGHASDQYSLAVGYVELRTGQLPFEDLTYLAVVEANRDGNLDLSRLPPAEQKVIRKATALNPEDRYSTSLEMVHALRHAVEGTSEPQRERSAATYMLVLGVLLVGLPLGTWVWMARETLFPRNGGVINHENTAQSYTISFVPQDATVTINGAPASLTPDGTTPVELKATDRVSIKASHPEDYLTFDREYTVEQLQAIDFKIALEHNGRYFEKRALEQLDKGDFAAAVEEYRLAIRAEPSYDEPRPIVLRKHTKAVQALAATPDGKWVVSTGDNGTTFAWPLAQPADGMEPVPLQGHSEDALIETVAVSSDGRWAVTGGWDDLAIAWDLSAKNPSETAVKLAGHTEDIVATAITADRKWIITASMDGTARLWPLSNGGVPDATRSIELTGHESQLDSIAVSPDSRWLVTLDGDGGAFRWDLQAAKPAETRLSLGPIPHKLNVVQVTPDSKWLIVGTDEGKVAVYGLDGMAPRREVSASGDEIESLAIDQSGKQLFAGDTVGNIIRFEVSASGELSNQSRLIGHVAPCVSLAVDPAGTFLVSGSWDQSARFWDLTATDSKTPLSLPLGGANGQVSKVAVSGDGKWIASAADDGTVLLWEVRRCRLLLHATGGALPRPKNKIET